MTDPQSSAGRRPTPADPDPFRRLVAIMECLLAPGGCPWDREQSHRSLLPHLIEEAYEVCEAVEEEDFRELQGELGDLGLQIVFHAALAQREGHFNIDDVYAHICEKLIRRHPHVFGDIEVDGSAAVTRNWEAIKRQEREEKRSADERSPSALDGVPNALPALQRAARLQSKARKVGFDWDNTGPVFEKIHEEINELAERHEQMDQDKIEDELGDLFFALVNLARFLDVDPEQALQRTNRKFTRRFHFIEAEAERTGRRLPDMTLEEMDAFWERSKKELGPT